MPFNGKLTILSLCLSVYVVSMLLVLRFVFILSAAGLLGAADTSNCVRYLYQAKFLLLNVSNV